MIVIAKKEKIKNVFNIEFIKDYATLETKGFVFSKNGGEIEKRVIPVDEIFEIKNEEMSEQERWLRGE